MTTVCRFRPVRIAVVAACAALVTLGARGPALAQAPTAAINHFTCYEVRKLPFETVNVDVENPFGPTSIDVKKPKRLCNPTNKNGEDPLAPIADEHFVGYRTKQTEPRRVELQRGLTVTNQFGTLLVDAKKPDIFMVPSAKSEVGPPLPLADPLPIDHYECYRVRSAKATFPTVEIEDQFGPLTLEVKRPRSVCIATDLMGNGILEPEVHLACYKVKTAKRTPRFPGRDLVFVSNAFGNAQGLDFLTVTRPTEICLPSTITRCFTTPILGPCP